MRHIEISRSAGGRLEARSSLRKFKKSPQYRALLQATIRDTPKREAGAANETERRRARLDKMEASLELEKLTNGGAVDEFSGLLALPDPLREGEE